MRDLLRKRYGTLGRPFSSTPQARDGQVVTATGELLTTKRDTGGGLRPDTLTLPVAPVAVRALGHLSYGATPASIAQFNALGGTDTDRVANYVEWQLDWSSIDDSALDTRLANAGYTTLGKNLTQLWADHVASDPA
ncbi:hypothetical protein [Agrilutibacter solisilvae]|uniref:Uncharacterized protein n=1 Tax=Agrilutibacter solisilvae TaxID=2763317 RepID=A0A974XYP4_9GAMM|nr:hypothetical protein [Lysobacter solisilvae]QSX78134.1 hypothetical protein I8J32_015780 [Lysobacter solisilvae]